MQNLKSQAYKFLSELEAALERALPPPNDLRAEIRAIVTSAKKGDANAHLRWPEGAFLGGYVVPTIHATLKSRGLSASEARQALLSESFRRMSDMCSGTPARKDPHPFDKVLAPSTHQIAQKWRTTSPLKQSCPDLALRAPCDFTVVFEGKYFEQGGLQRAETELVTNLYQAFFYRALPKIPGTDARPAWEYDFACLLACDASLKGSLKSAWSSLDPSARRGFWDGANVYVMILRNGD